MAGPQCQFVATDNCTNPLIGTNVQEGQSPAPRRFCANGGTCGFDTATDSYHCLCQAGYGGENCGQAIPVDAPVASPMTAPPPSRAPTILRNSDVPSMVPSDVPSYVPTLRSSPPSASPVLVVMDTTANPSIDMDDAGTTSASPTLAPSRAPDDVTTVRGAGGSGGSYRIVTSPTGLQLLLLSVSATMHVLICFSHTVGK